MKVGDLVIRNVNVPNWKTARAQREELGHGLVLSKQMAGKPSHMCVTVFYPKTGEIWDIAESHMKVISATGRSSWKS